MPHLERDVRGLEHALVERVVDRLLALEPEGTAVLITGSYAGGTAAVGSDLDVTVLTPSPRVNYRTWFESRSGDAPLHVSAGATTAGAWRANGEAPARWSLGFPARNTAFYLWAEPQTRTAK